MKTSDLIQQPILWRNSNNAHFYYYNCSERIIYLRLNNFPDEVMYTLINELDIVDLEESPDRWEFEDW